MLCLEFEYRILNPNLVFRIWKRRFYAWVQNDMLGSINHVTTILAVNPRMPLEVRQQVYKHMAKRTPDSQDYAAWPLQHN